MMLDSRATVCCLAKRCLTASPCLKDLPIVPYKGSGILDANGKHLQTYGVIKAPPVLGHPSLCYTIEFIIIDSLPYSCILGLSFLRQLDTWGFDNSTQTLCLNQSTL